MDIICKLVIVLAYFFFFFFDRVGACLFIEQVHRTFKASKQFMPDSPILSCYFACLLALVASMTTATTFTSSSESITSQLWNQLLWQNFWAVVRELFLCWEQKCQRILCSTLFANDTQFVYEEKAQRRWDRCIFKSHLSVVPTILFGSYLLKCRTFAIRLGMMVHDHKLERN